MTRFPLSDIGEQPSIKTDDSRASAVPKTVYVWEKGGSDSNDGSSARPFRTIQRGVEAADTPGDR